MMNLSGLLAPRSRLLLAALILGTCVGCDQVTKVIATRTLRDTPPRSFLANTVRFDYALNPGGFLSLGSRLPADARRWIFVGLNSLTMLVILGLLLFGRRLRLATFVSLAFIFGGGIGNLIDRVFNEGLVTDFINLGVGPLRTGVFNVADIAVTFGGIAIFVLTTFARPEPDHERQSTDRSSDRSVE